MAKYGIPIQAFSTPISVSSPGAEMVANTGCHQLTLKIGDYEFPTDLVIL